MLVYVVIFLDLRHKCQFRQSKSKNIHDSFHCFISNNCWEIIHGFRHVWTGLFGCLSGFTWGLSPESCGAGGFPKKNTILGVKKRQKCEVKKDYRVFEHQTYPNTIFLWANMRGWTTVFFVLSVPANPWDWTWKSNDWWPLDQRLVS